MSKRILVAAAIIAFWGAMMAALVYREVIRPRMLSQAEQAMDAEAPATTALEGPRDYWMGIYLNGGERAGFVNVRARPETRDAAPGQHIMISGRAQLNMFNFDTGMTLSARGWMADDYSRAEFDGTLHAGPSESRAYGRFENDSLAATFVTGGIETPLKFPVSKEMLSGLGLGGPAYEIPQLEPGEEVYIDAFDPSTMKPGKARLYCEGRETILAAGKMVETSIISITVGGMVSKAWVTQDLETVRMQTPFGIEVRQITAEEALEPLTTTERMPLLEATIVTPTGQPVARGVAQMRIRMSGLPEDVAVPTDANQRMNDDGTIYIESPDAESVSNAPMTSMEDAPSPPSSGEREGVRGSSHVQTSLDPEDRTAALASDPLVNADAEAIRLAAAEAIGDAEGDWPKALALYRWVYDNIAKVPTLSVPAAVEVLRTREGDCNEHTVLFAAMARAAGIPCQIAIGLVYSEALGGFGYHAWPEVWVGAWIPMDPTLGQPVCDATHIKLLNGGIDKWPLLAGFMGKIQIEVLETAGLVETEEGEEPRGGMVQ